MKCDDSKKGNILIHHPEHGNGKSRLFCFPSSGSGAGLFRVWRKLLPDSIDLAIVQLPGREQRMSEPPILDQARLMSELCEGVAPYLDKPFAFLGHSMGGLIAVNLIDQLQKLNKPLPYMLYVSAAAPEEIFLTKFDYDKMLSSTDEGFISDVQKHFNGIPKFVLDSPELLHLFLPVMRNDFRLTHSFSIKARSLNIPIVTFLGDADPAFTAEEFEIWKNHTSMNVSNIIVPGGHFAILDHPELYVAEVLKYAP